MPPPKKKTTGSKKPLTEAQEFGIAVAASSKLIKDTPERRASLTALLTSAEAQMGKGAIMSGEAEISDAMAVDCIPTGDPDIDWILTNGRGIPRGRIIEIYGPESSGKTTLALTFIAAVQRAGGRAGFVDVEHALDPEYAEALGVNLDEMPTSQPDSGEQALDIVELMVKSKAIDIVVVDSVAALVTKRELEGHMGQDHVGLLARLMSQALRKLTHAVSDTGCTVVFVNQLREKVGGMGHGPTETTSGGRALKFYASIRLDVRKIEQIKIGAAEDSDVIGHKTRIKTPKNKVFKPFRQITLDLRYPQTVDGKLVGAGFDRYGSVLDRAVMASHQLIIKEGAWYSLNDAPDKAKRTKIGQGREAARRYLMEHSDIFTSLLGKVAGGAR